MKKLLLVSLIAALALSACDKKETPLANEATKESTTAQMQDGHDHNHEEHDHEGHNHDHSHEGHDHSHGDHTGHDHSHAPAGSVAYSCADGKSIHVAVVEHEGESEAQLTYDDIVYDMSQDVQSKGRYTATDSISGENQGMALTIDGTTAKLASFDGKELLSCTKK